ncbi:hypothetical protein AXG93_4182s1250 [Marchantia polymorpha subsp. ruderalis]|uniref:Uncharacterized protein n=1 Tax=Marchantia polymorpha subsp. ruderalis TaxID=1480154 RepID=A0A176VF09_MARPO|nr:hypothetical protein AXG93_4182s1250 [Marchantia polymorpha subsp. ruderalis]
MRLFQLGIQIYNELRRLNHLVLVMCLDRILSEGGVHVVGRLAARGRCARACGNEKSRKEDEDEDEERLRRREEVGTPRAEGEETIALRRPNSVAHGGQEDSVRVFEVLHALVGFAVVGCLRCKARMVQVMRVSYGLLIAGE